MIVLDPEIIALPLSALHSRIQRWPAENQIQAYGKELVFPKVKLHDTAKNNTR
jgi:hypothetical protein